MTQTFYICPQCGATTTRLGLCDRCLERQTHHQRQQHPRQTLHLLTLLTLLRTPLAWFTALVILACTYDSAHFLGRLLHTFMPFPVLFTLPLFLLTLTLSRGHRLLPRTLNWPLFLFGLMLGSPLYATALYLADHHLPPRFKLASPSPLWPWNQYTLLALTFITASLTLGAL